MTDGLGCGGGPDNRERLARKGVGAVSLHDGAQRRWAGEGRDVKRRWGWQRTAGSGLVGRDHINLAASVAQGLYEGIAAGKGMREEQPGAGFEVAERFHETLLPLVGGHEICAGAGFLECPRGFCSHCGEARTTPPGRKAAAVNA